MSHYDGFVSIRAININKNGGGRSFVKVIITKLMIKPRAAVGIK